MRIFISPVGTSSLTNFVKKNKLALDVYEYANLSEEEYSADIKAEFDRIVEELKEQAETWSVVDAKKASAELNGLLSFDKDMVSDDLLFFIVTDTYQSNLAFEVVNAYLSNKFGVEGQKIKLKSLTTKNKNDFLEGIKELLRWSNENLSGYRENNYSIYFNLTGGFKSLLGYLTPIGMFYADSIFYIFETGDLIEIPKLPLRIDEELFAKYAEEFLLLDANFFLEKDKVSAIPLTLLENVTNNLYGLSVWGELMWSQVKQKILTQNLLKLPHIGYEKSFVDDFNNRNNNQQKIQLQETLAKVSRLLHDNKNDTGVLRRDNGLSYENCKVKKQGKTIGHFRYNQAQRVSCIVEKDHLTLLRNGFHDVCD